MRVVLVRLMVTGTTVVGILFGSVAWAERGPVPTKLPVFIAPGDTDKTVVVKRGDHLWRISEYHLNGALGRHATGREITPYWRRVIETNLTNLRSGDPDLIYPGEVVTLPAVTSERP